MDDKPTYYEAPENHSSHIRKMTIWLGVFFGALIIVAILVVIFAGTLAKMLPFSAEKRFVRPYEAMADFFYDEELTAEETAIIHYLQSLGSTLIDRLDIPDDYDIQFHYIDDDAENAFATLGGHVFIFRGLLEAVPDENSLAMILAHEIAHVKNRDPLAAMGRLYSLQLVMSFASGDYSSGLGLTMDTGQLGLLYFSREQEEAADLEAITAIEETYGHVQGYDTFFNFILEKYSEDGDPQDSGAFDLEQLLSTHPRLRTRIATLKDVANERGYFEEGNVKPLPQDLERNVAAVKRQKVRERREGE
ncbi:MAG: M48 family metallopeptidase [Gammaproteobacteria bacterium]